MTWYNNLSTRTKLFLGFGVMCAFLAIVIGTAYSSLATIERAGRFSLDVVSLRADLNRQRAQLLEASLQSGSKELEAIRREIDARSRTIDETFERLSAFAGARATTRVRFEEMSAIIAAYRATRETEFQMLHAGNVDEARLLTMTTQQERSDSLSRIAQELGALAAEDSDRVAARAEMIFVGVGVLALVIGGIMVLVLNRAIAGRVAAYMRLVECIGRGDLTQQAEIIALDPTASGNEFDRLGHFLNQMVAGLNDLAGQTASVAGNLNSAAAEILASTQQQAGSTKEQAVTVQEITSTMQEINQSGGQISDRARQVAAAAQAASSAGKSGLDAVTENSRVMETIREQVEEVAENIVALSEKTQAVGEIIVTVNEIAEQSNLLALNASIEAVSAGEHGGRFSVVAGEMKSLADRAKQCTVQVRTILGEIQKGINTSVMLTEEAFKRVEVGKQQASMTGDTIRRMTESTDQSVQAFQQIIGATSQQQVGFDQVTRGMEDIRQAASQTAAGTSQLERAVANVTALSQQLKSAVGRYQIR